MAFYIDIEKTKETGEYAEYKFYSIKGYEGLLQVNKATGTVTLVKKIEGDDAGILFERAAWAIIKHWQNNKFPEKTYWAS